jgi:4-carboxymuconolactone decarboxylase
MKSRLSELTPGQVSVEQQRVLDAILSGPRGNPDGLFLAWVHSPGLADPAQALGAYCRYHTSMPLRLSELAILVTAAWWQFQAEWQIHEPIARRAGIADPVIDALRLGCAPVLERTDEQLVYQIGCILYQTKLNESTMRSITVPSPSLASLHWSSWWQSLVNTCWSPWH